jgi:hypothetical protein
MFKVGLFGHDLTRFWEDCKDTEKCDLHNYDDFTGWALGVHARVSTDSPNGGEKMTQGICFTADYWCIFFRKYLYSTDDVEEYRYLLNILRADERPGTNFPTQSDKYMVKLDSSKEFWK